MSKEIYNEAFYQNRHQDTLHSAQTILRLVIGALPKINSAVEFGCGVGTWLSILKENGVGEVCGYDGPWVDEKYRIISPQEFRTADFEKPVVVEKKYDLAISLEVAEHISGENAMQFVESLTNASDYVLFSAAIPNQGGSNHVNEQYPKYWNDLFVKKGFGALDFLRLQVWNDPKVLTWYRQNVIMFVKEGRISEMPPPLQKLCQKEPLSLVHPDIFLRIIKDFNNSQKTIRERIRERIREKITKILAIHPYNR